jgi:hypothetical protein
MFKRKGVVNKESLEVIRDEESVEIWPTARGVNKKEKGERALGETEVENKNGRGMKQKASGPRPNKEVN